MSALTRELRQGLQAYIRYLAALENSPLTETHPELQAEHMGHRAVLVQRYGEARMRKKYRRYGGAVIWKVGSVTYRRL